jgi:hypothetical protein
MPRSTPWFWLLLALLLLVPSPAGRFLLDVIGGLTLTLLLLPLLAGAAALIAWQVLRRRLRSCPSCGLASFGQPVCPACGSMFDLGEASQAGDQPIDPRTVTITVEAVDVKNSDDSDAKEGGDAHKP